MSIRERIQAWIDGGELVFVEPAYDALPIARYVFAGPEVKKGLFGPWTGNDERARFGRARAHVDSFIVGELIALRLPPSKAVGAHTALLECPKNEVWEMRPRIPKPGIRIFGRFSEKDTFIALTLAFREELKTDDDWKHEIERCKREWRKYFPTFPPFSGSDGYAYASNIFLV